MKVAVHSVAVLILLLALPAAAQSDIRFGVLGLFHPRELEIAPASSQPLRISGARQALIINGEPGHRRLLLRASGDRILISGFSATQVQASARNGSPVRFQLTIPGKLHRVYEGALIVTASRDQLTSIVSMDREAAVATIVASEMKVDAPIEALKAQAVVTRSFVAAGPRHRAFDFCDTTHCQYLRSPDDVSSRVRAAVEATRGVVLTWRNHVIPALYASRCGGQTRTLREAGMDPGDGYPYYSVPCRWCREHPVRWQTRIPSGTPAPDPASEPSRIAHARLWGWSALPGDRFSIEHDRDGILIDGRNIGHALGLCQFGAIGMASSGADYRSILSHFYPNTELTQVFQ